MWKDPIVEETRKIRVQYASKFNHDIDAIFEDIQKRQIRSTIKPVSLPPRKPSQNPGSNPTPGKLADAIVFKKDIVSPLGNDEWEASQ